MGLALQKSPNTKKLNKKRLNIFVVYLCYSFCCSSWFLISCRIFSFFFFCNRTEIMFRKTTVFSGKKKGVVLFTTYAFTKHM